MLIVDCVHQGHVRMKIPPRRTRRKNPVACQQLTRCHRAAPRQKLARFVRCSRDLRWLSALAVAGPVREQPRPSHPTAQSPRGGGPGVLGEKRLSRLTPPRPAGRGPQRGSRVGVPRRPVRGHPREANVIRSPHLIEVDAHRFRHPAHSCPSFCTGAGATQSSVPSHQSLAGH